MELRDLRVFITVVEERGFTRAAGRLHLVQSSVSDAVGRLERELDLRLIERGRHGVRLTPAGDRLLPWARLMVSSAERAAEDVADFTRFSSGTVRFGVLSTLVPLVLPRLLIELRTRFPRLEVRIEEGLATALVDRLAAGDLDIVVVFFPTQRRDGLTFTEVTDARFSVLVPPSHRLVRRSTTLRELADQRWVTFPPHNPGRVWLEEACRLAGFSPAIAAVVETHAQQRMFVQAGYGVAAVPFGEAPWWSPLQSVPLAPPLPDFRIGYAYDARRPYRSLAAIMDIVAAAIERVDDEAGR